MLKQRNTEGQDRCLSYIHMCSCVPIAWKRRTGKKQRIKKKDDTDGSRSTEKVKRNPRTYCCQVLSANDVYSIYDQKWLAQTINPHIHPNPTISVYCCSTLVGSSSRLLEQLQTFPISIISIDSSSHPFTIPNQNLAQNSPLSGFPSFCRLQEAPTRTGSRERWAGRNYHQHLCAQEQREKNPEAGVMRTGTYKLLLDTLTSFLTCLQVGLPEQPPLKRKK